MRNILVIAYQLHYSAGSEYAVAMDYIRHMSQNNKLTVLFGTCNTFHRIGNTFEMEEWAKTHPIENVKIVGVKPSFKPSDSGSSIYGSIRFYKEYRKWHKDALEKAKELHKASPFDLVHYIGPIGYREPGFMHELGIPYLRGPIGGFGMINPRLCKATFSLSGGFSLVMKGLLNVLQYHLDKRVKRSFRNTDVVLCATSGWKHTVEQIAGDNHHSIIQYLPENCIDMLSPLSYQKFESTTINIIFIGWLNSRKALILILEALSRVKDKSKIKLHVLGEGPLKKKYQQWANNHKIADMVVWHGKIPREKVYDLLDQSHLMCMPSLMDANTTVIWEAMSKCIPTLALDHFGFHDTIVNAQTGYLVKVSCYSNVVGDIVSIFNSIIDSPSILKEMAENVAVDRLRYTWEERTKRFEEVYDITIKNHKDGNRFS